MSLLLSLALAQTAAAATAVAASDRVIEHAIGMWQIANAGATGRRPLAAISPDGGRLAIVVSRGLLASGVTEHELRTYRLERHADASITAREETVFRRATTGNPPAITSVRWLDDGETLAFLAVPDSVSPYSHQVHLLDTRTKVAVPRTASRLPILAYGASRDGSTLVYAARVPVDSMARQQERLRGVVARPEQPGFEFDADTPYGSDIDFFVQRGGRPAELLYRTTTGELFATVPYFESSGFVEVSPSGSHAVVGMHFPDSVPTRWRDYGAAGIRDFLDLREQPPPTYALIDLSTKRRSLLLDAPSVWSGTMAVWAPGGHRVFVTGYLPLGDADSVAARVSRSAGAILEVDIETSTARVVTEEIWRLAQVTETGDTLFLVRSGSRATAAGREARVTGRTYARGLDAWEAADSSEHSVDLFNGWSAVSASAQLVVGVRETLDESPELAVYDRITGRSGVITSLNPQLASVPRGTVRHVTWTSSRGDVWEAHLVTPVGYAPGRRYPAVIMIMDMSYRDGYVLDGRFYKSSYPVQALANRGMAVLMVYFPQVFFDHYVKPLEREIILTGIDGAFEYLVREGLADSTRIGITGFSHAGYVTQYVIAQSRHRYAAAIAIDNFDGGYVGYVVFNFRSTMNALDEYYGGHPFGPAIAEWHREAPPFAADRVRTPLLLQKHGSSRLGETPTSHISGWETYVGLQRLGKPVELVRHRYGQHILEKPIEQHSSAQRQVDWLCFWLNDEIDPAEAKREQFARWTRMRERSLTLVPEAVDLGQ